MKKTFVLDEVDCANCARKMQEGAAKIEGVTSVSVNFLTQKLTLEAPDEIFDEVLKKVVKVCAKVEPDCKVIIK